MTSRLPARSGVVRRLPAAVAASVARLSAGERVATVGALVCLVGVFLPWMGGATLPECDPTQFVCTLPGSSKNGLNGVGLGVVVVVLAVVVLLAIRTPALRGLAALQPLSPTDGLAYFVAGGLTLIGVLVFLGEYRTINGTTRSPQVGFAVMVAGALLLAVGGLTVSQRARRTAVSHEREAPPGAGLAGLLVEGRVPASAPDTGTDTGTGRPPDTPPVG